MWLLMIVSSAVLQPPSDGPPACTVSTPWFCLPDEGGFRDELPLDESRHAQTAPSSVHVNPPPELGGQDRGRDANMLPLAAQECPMSHVCREVCMKHSMYIRLHICCIA